MCGIAGILSSIGENFEENKVKLSKMSLYIKQRGPDSNDYFSWKNNHVQVHFAHTRLSIIDLDQSANQPFFKNDLVVIFNGEIYNYLEILNELKRNHGVTFKTNSDTEVLLESYRIWGLAFLEIIQGMFAFAILDIKSNKLLLVRDHFGMKPLYYGKLLDPLTGISSFIFSSDIRSIVRNYPEFKKINFSSVVNISHFLWSHHEDTMFENIQKLSPGYYIEINLNHVFETGNLVPKQFWNIKDHINMNYSKFSTFDSCLNLLDKKILESIEKHLRADVEVGAFLSGGLDSSLICRLAQDRLHSPLKTFTIKFIQDEINLSKNSDDYFYAEKVAKLYNFNHNTIEMSPNIMDLLPHIIDHLNEPIGDPAAINTYLISKIARERGIKVLLSGMGADEIFGGYRRHLASYMTSKGSILPSFVKKLPLQFLNLFPSSLNNRSIKEINWLKRFFKILNNKDLDESYLKSYSYYDSEGIRNLFSGLNEKKAMAIYKEIGQQHSSTFHDFPNKNDVINQFCYTDLFYFLEGLNLTYTDRMTMANGIEARTPFVDKELISFAMTIPGKWKIKNFQSKFILKKVAEKYLPKEIIYRPKSSFGLPIKSWLKNELKDLTLDILNNAQIEKRGLFNYSHVSKILSDFYSGKEDYSFQIYQFLVFELWFKQYYD
jgi:asparagine synthase (glutamine-hydrolysing)